ncbi:MAG: hypothetical protein IJB65_02520 [Clostridia bacterium]|nr:hypothetical protein [Clostridia bacterium]
MRSNKEQLDIILQRKQKAEAIRSQRRKLMYTSFSIVICLCALCAAVYASRGTKLFGNKEETATNNYSDVENVLAGDSIEEGDSEFIGSLDNQVNPDASDRYPSESQGFQGDAELDDGSFEEWVEGESAEENSFYNETQDDEIEEDFSEECEEGDNAADVSMPESYREVYTIACSGETSVLQKQLEGYEDNISYLPGRENMGLAMAWMLHIGGKEMYYHTVIQLSEGQTIGDELNGRFVADDMYYCIMSYWQVIQYATNGYKCLFVGRGIGNNENLILSDKEGIEIYCQLYGDMLVAEIATPY